MGFVGGTGVNIYRRFVASQSPETRPTFDFVYYAQFIGLAVLGGVVAWAHDKSMEISPITALNLGLSVPALIKVGAEPIRKPSKPRRIN